MILLIDNYDSFTYNIVQMLEEMGEEVKVFRNDEIDLPGIEAQEPSVFMVSPGPGTPKDAGVSMAAIKKLAPTMPVLGVCLGHQSIIEAYGGKIIRADRIMHGKSSRIFHDNKTIYKNLPNPFDAIRYHSLIAEKVSLPDCFEISAWTERGEIMGVRHKEYQMEGMQFHPESILTEAGPLLLKNFAEMGK